MSGCSATRGGKPGTRHWHRPPRSAYARRAAPEVRLRVRPRVRLRMRLGLRVRLRLRLR